MMIPFPANPPCGAWPSSFMTKIMTAEQIRAWTTGKCIARFKRGEFVIEHNENDENEYVLQPSNGSLLHLVKVQPKGTKKERNGKMKDCFAGF